MDTVNKTENTISQGNLLNTESELNTPWNVLEPKRNSPLLHYINTGPPFYMWDQQKIIVSQIGHKTTQNNTLFHQKRSPT